jgi:hypothetical protein
MEGYSVLFDDKFSTVWSAPNYCYRFENLASLLYIDEKLNREFVIYAEAPDNEREGFSQQSDDVIENFFIYLA